jgi:hypothetical protein
MDFTIWITNEEGGRIGAVLLHEQDELYFGIEITAEDADGRVAALGALVIEEGPTLGEFHARQTEPKLVPVG